MLLISSPRFAEHTPPPGHPERPERADVFDAVARWWRESGGRVIAPRAATVEELVRVHTRRYVDDMASTIGRAVMLDVDTFTSPETYDIVRLAAGAAVEAATHTWEHGEPAIALVRPPGHHAEPGRAMGFCVFNNVAVAAAALRARGVERVAIVDIDVHHGNGTQTMFYEDPTVLYVSTHQYPYYPRTGAADETGAGPGRGTTLNIPLDAGATDATYHTVHEKLVVPALIEFRPSIILVSAGFDAHERDPLGGMRVTTRGYEQIVGMLASAASELCAGRIAVVTEGGYHLGALRECLDATIGVLK
jgi:acetoin utilization deacetylase AcuC-like enzyme